MTPYDEGYRAGLRGADQNTCPYSDENEDDRDDWFDGWNDGMAERYRDDDEDDF